MKCKYCDKIGILRPSYVYLILLDLKDNRIFQNDIHYSL